MPTAKQIESMQSRAPKVQNGTYVVTDTKGGHIKIKIHTARGGDYRGRRLISLTSGPFGSTDFHPVAFWEEAEHESHFPTSFVWPRFRGPRGDGEGYFTMHHPDGSNWDSKWGPFEKKIGLILGLVSPNATDFLKGEGYTYKLWPHCVVCNQPLDQAESIKYGIGPICASR